MSNMMPIEDIEYLTIPTKKGNRLQLTRTNGEISVNGIFHLSELEKVSNQIENGKWHSGVNREDGAEVENVNIGIRTFRGKDGSTEYDKPLPWMTKYFNMVEIRGESGSGKTELLRSMMYEMRDLSHVFMIDPFGSIGVDLPVNQWMFSPEEKFGLGLFQPYGLKQISREDTELTMQLAVDFLKAALDLTPGQVALLLKYLGSLYDKYWKEVERGAKGRPRFPTIKMLAYEINEQSGSAAVSLHNNLTKLFRYGSVFDNSLPRDTSACVFSYEKLPNKLKDLMTYVLLNKLAMAPYKTVLLLEYSSLPWSKVDRRNDVLTSVFRDAQKEKLNLIYTVNQGEVRPKFVKLNQEKLLYIQLKHESAGNSVLKPVYKVGYGRVTGRNNEHWIRIPSLDERMEMIQVQASISSEEVKVIESKGEDIGMSFVEPLNENVSTNTESTSDLNKDDKADPLLEGLT